VQKTVVYRKIPRPQPSLIETLRGIPVADLHDEMDPVQRRLRLMHHSMRPLFPSAPFVGPAVTAYNTPGDNLMMHTALYYAEKGDVIVVSNGGIPHGALWGGNASIQAVRRGVVALVADGPVRDTAQVKDLAVAVWSTSITVSKPGKEAPGMVNVPINCAGVLVSPGDIVVGDEDGVIVIDPADAERLAAAARARIKRDDVMQTAIAKGSTLFEQIGCEDRLKALNAVVADGPWTAAR
jgi:4-hydroxy-4-methyl-2-oxoglutarate aldolase